MKENRKLKTLIVILSCLLVLLGTYVFYLEYNKDTNYNEVSASETNTTEKTEEKESKDTEVHNIFTKYAENILNNNKEYRTYELENNGSFTYFLLTPKGEVYITTIDEQSFNCNEDEYKDEFEKIKNEMIEIPNYKKYDKPIKGYKLQLNNIISMGIYKTDQDGTHVVTFVKSDGSVYYLETGGMFSSNPKELFVNGNLNIVQSNLKNIVRFESVITDSWMVYAVDINGNTYLLNI